MYNHKQKQMLTKNNAKIKKKQQKNNKSVVILGLGNVQEALSAVKYFSQLFFSDQ